MIAYEIRTLDALPWPAGLGKNLEYPGLEYQLGQLLGDSWRDPEVNRHALETNLEYRAILERAFADAPWRARLFDAVQTATELARRSPLLGMKTGDTTAWSTWTRELDSLDFDTQSWLRHPAKFAHNRFTDGRHRITCLRLHHPPSLPVLVKIDYDR